MSLPLERNSVKSSGSLVLQEVLDNEKQKRSSFVKKSRKTLSPHESITLNNTEIEQLFTDIKIAREHANDAIKLLPPITKLSDVLNEHQQHTETLKNVMQNITEMKSDNRQGFNKCLSATAMTASSISHEMSDRNLLLTHIVQKWKLILEKSKDYIKQRSDYDKAFKEYNKISDKINAMNTTSKPDVKKAASLKEQQDESTKKTLTEGDKLRNIYNTIYVEFMHGMMDYQMNLIHNIKKDFDNGLVEWNKIVDEGDDDEEQQNPPEWMNNYPNCYHLFQAESMYIENMNNMAQIYAKEILYDSKLALLGFSLDDVNLIFSGIELIRRLHSGIFKKLTQCSQDTFVDVYSSRIARIYEVYHKHTSKFGKAFTRFHKCIQIEPFKKMIDQIATTNKIQPLDELLRSPFIQLSQYVPIFTKLRTDFPDSIENLDSLIYVFTRLAGYCELAENNFATAMEMNKIHNIPSNQPPYRRYFSTFPCNVSKVEGQIFLFSDVLIFTKSDKEHPCVFVEQYDTNNIEKFEIKLKNVQKNYPKLIILIIIKKIFGVDITLATNLREEDSYIFPSVLHNVFNALEEHAPTTEGVLRLSSNVIELDALIYKIDAGGDINESKTDALLLGNIVKKYCDNLPNKLPIELQTVECSKETILPILRTLDIPFLAFIQRLFAVLYKISQSSSENLMTSENLSKVISPNIYPADNTSFDIEKLTRTITYMINNYLDVFEEIQHEMNQLYQNGVEERMKREKMENLILQASTTEKDIPISSNFQASNENSVVLTLIDILRQGSAELIEGKKTSKRWIVLKRKCLMIFKELGQSKTENVIPLSSCFMTESDNNSVMNLSLGDKYFYSFVFLDNQKKWVKLVKSAMKQAE
ncbi:Rho/RAC guanine nucleotide exchange factor [Entamoeba marina]